MVALYISRVYRVEINLYFLFQATSILGHKRKNPDQAVLPTSPEERQNLRRDDSLASEFDRRVEELDRQFDCVCISKFFNVEKSYGEEHTISISYKVCPCSIV